MEGKYRMDHQYRGKSLVINIRNFDATTDPKTQLEERVWSERDVENLTKTLVYLEFQLVLCQNLTKKEIISTLAEQASADHSNSDCFLCVVM